MSTEAPASITPVQAYDHIMDRVHNPVFFHKLANLGVVPRNQKEASQLLDIGQKLFAEHQRSLAAHAEKQGSFLDFAQARLDSLTGAADSYSDLQVKQASVDCMADASIQQAARTLAQALIAA